MKILALKTRYDIDLISFPPEEKRLAKNGVLLIASVDYRGINIIAQVDPKNNLAVYARGVSEGFRTHIKRFYFDDNEPHVITKQRGDLGQPGSTVSSVSFKAIESNNPSQKDITNYIVIMNSWGCCFPYNSMFETIKRRRFGVRKAVNDGASELRDIYRHYTNLIEKYDSWRALGLKGPTIKPLPKQFVTELTIALTLAEK